MDEMGRWYDAARALLPEGIAVWDAHTHTGANDPDGVKGTSGRLLEKLAAAGHSGAVVTTSQDPGGYGAANDRVIAEARSAGSRLVPFARVDPRRGAEAVSEAERSLDAGHRGIKLHPRAERFTLGDPTVEAVARLAAERGVPVLSHAGRGIPSLGRDAAALCERVDGLRLILAHAAISDLSWLGPAAADHPGLYFDTAWWDVTDLLALFAWVPPGRILYASDPPYGHPELAFILTMRVAASARYHPAQLEGLFGGTLRRLLDGEDGDDLGPAPGDDFVTGDPGLLRVHASLHGAVVQAFSGADMAEPVSLARLGCVVPDDAHHAGTLRAVADLLAGIDLTAPQRSRTVRPLIVAAAATLTPDVSVPDPADS
jgi:predicted TIM-barrel fold metal-dependent hydrolase